MEAWLELERERCDTAEPLLLRGTAVPGATAGEDAPASSLLPDDKYGLSCSSLLLEMWL